ncbi:MAG: PAS domain S-box protein [Methanomicrobiales archaeon]
MIRILHVDDEEGMLALTKDFLQQSGHFAVTTAQSAEIAWDLLRREPFDAVVSDYQMPAMDGIELLRAVRNSGWDIPFIIFTGKGREEVVVEAIDTGVDFYLQKGGRPRSQFAELAHKIQSAVERKSAERAVRASERNFRQIFNTAPNLMLALDHEGTIVDCNSRVMEVLGFTPDELIGRKINTLAPGTRSASIETAINNLLRQGAVTAFDTRLLTQSGHAIEGRISASVMKGRDGSPARIICAIEDITSRERAQRALFEEKDRLKVTLKSIGDGVIVTDAVGRISLMNDVASELTGWEEENAGGRLLEEVFCIINEESRVPCSNPVDRVMSSGKVVELANHTILIASDGTERMIADSAAPIHDDDGRVTGVILVFRDVTEKRRREDEIRKVRARVPEPRRHPPSHHLPGRPGREYRLHESERTGGTGRLRGGGAGPAVHPEHPP